MRVGPENDRVTIRPLKNYKPPASILAFKKSNKRAEDPKDLRIDSERPAENKESVDSGSVAASQTAGAPSSPSLITSEQAKLPVPTLSPLLSAETLHRDSFLKLFEGSEQKAWSKLLTHTPKYSPDKIDVPFPYPGDENGRLEQNHLPVVVHGLRAKGGHAQARGILENWLHLGERYTALPGTNQLNDLGRAGQPRLSSLLLEEAERHPDPTFLERSYQVVSDDHQHSWSDGYFKQSKNGLNRFCDVDYSHDATLDESGGQHNKARFGGDPMPFNPVDLNAYLYRTEKDLETMARKLALKSEQPEQWEKKAQQWGTKAAERKGKMLKTMWSDDKKTFSDIRVEDGSRTEFETLAALSVLEAGVLDPGIPKERQMAQELARSVTRFTTGEGDVKWDLKSETAAPAPELLGFSRGLASYGFKAESQQLKQAAQKAVSDGNDITSLASRAWLSENQSPQETGLEGWMSPKGMSRLRTLAGNTGLSDLPNVGLKEAGTLDRQLGKLHSSVLERPVVQHLQKHDLLEPILGVSIQKSGVSPAKEQPKNFKETTPEFQMGPTKVSLDLPKVEKADLGEGAVKLRRNGKELNICTLEGKLLVGHRAYSLDKLNDPSKLKLPQDIVGAFHTAGENPQLEEFFHANRDWVSVETGPQSKFDTIPGRPGWGKLYNDIGKNWKELTIEPSVTDHDTAMQYFNPAAVPSLGIFKTQFNWDTMFMAKGMQLQGQEETVAGMTDNLLYLLKSTGRVPNAARSVYLNKSQPPFLPSLVRMSEPIRKRTIGAQATQKWVREAYDVMAGDFHNFWREDGARNVGEIKGEKVSLSRWGGPNHKFAMDESGFDTTSRFYGKTMDLVPPDLNAFLWGYSRDMEAIALRLRDQAEAEGNQTEYLKFSSEGAFWGAEANRIKQDVITHCWDEEDGMFRDYRFQGEDQGLQRDEDALSACVAPLWVGMLDPSIPEEKKMIERSLDNVSRFEKDHGLASTAEDYGHPEMQWNGPSGWAPLHMMTIESEVRYGRHDAAARHTQKWLDNIDDLYQKDGVIIERYDVVKGGHPPVQKGRYEETQGEGPGFGWTNATVPWALIEVVGGVRLHREAGTPTRMDVIPHLPEGTQEGPTRMTFTNPGTTAEWNLSHHYQKEQGSYDFQMEGDFTAVPNLVLLTPPMERGKLPKKGDNCPPYRIKEKPSEDGKVRYEVTFEGLSGQQELQLAW